MCDGEEEGCLCVVVRRRVLMCDGEEEECLCVMVRRRGAYV